MDAKLLQLVETIRDESTKQVKKLKIFAQS